MKSKISSSQLQTPREGDVLKPVELSQMELAQPSVKHGILYKNLLKKSELEKVIEDIRVNDAAKLDEFIKIFNFANEGEESCVKNLA